MLAQVKERLGSELDRLSHELAAGLVAGAHLVDGDEAPDPGREVIQNRIRRLGQLVAGLPALQPESLPADQVGYGSAVVLEDLATRARVSFTLVTADVIDLDEDQVTLASPIGAALLGHRAGDRITVTLPSGERRYRLVSVVTLPQALGLCAPARR